jgi:hypothetical protein
MHYESFGPKIEAFQKRDDHRITIEANADAGEYIFRVFDLPTPDPEWGLRVGDCLHNARAALDYLMVRLYALGTHEDPRDINGIQFPVCNSSSKFDDYPTVKKFCKYSALSIYLERIKELQPLNEHNPSIWSRSDPLTPGGRHAPVPLALSRLSEWDNIDKHRVIHATLLSGAVQFADVVRAPTGFKLVHEGRTYDPLKNGAEIGRWAFEPPLPSVWEPSEVDVKRYFPFEVSIDQLLPPKGILQIVPFCLWGVDQVLHLFEPVFTEGKPPLPVTAIS